MLVRATAKTMFAQVLQHLSEGRGGRGGAAAAAAATAELVDGGQMAKMLWHQHHYHPLLLQQ